MFVFAWQKYHLSLKIHYKIHIFYVACIKAEKVLRKAYADLQSLTHKSVWRQSFSYVAHKICSIYVLYSIEYAKNVKSKNDFEILKASLLKIFYIYVYLGLLDIPIKEIKLKNGFQIVSYELPSLIVALIRASLSHACLPLTLALIHPPLCTAY